jgi:hypothetical protein
LNSLNASNQSLKQAMKQMHVRLRPGDTVEVNPPEEILRTLDTEGTLDRLPFMPEMVEYCGKRFKVSKRVVKTCYYGTRSGMRKFAAQDVLILDGMRCSGVAHDGCERACTIFWREAWLRKIDAMDSAGLNFELPDTTLLRARLKTRTSNAYFCQASEILNATVDLSRSERFARCFEEVKAGNCGVFEMIHRIGIWLFWRARRLFFGSYGHGNAKSTPAQRLNLQSGELIEVKPMRSISDTLNDRSYNRGLYFSPDMGRLCGEQRRVERRIDKIIVDGTGQMRQMHNTVYLEGSVCGCASVAFGGCPRGEFAYWREIWLRRLEAPVESTGLPGTKAG